MHRSPTARRTKLGFKPRTLLLYGNSANIATALLPSLVIYIWCMALFWDLPAVQHSRRQVQDRL